MDFPSSPPARPSKIPVSKAPEFCYTKTVRLPKPALLWAIKNGILDFLDEDKE